MPSGLLEGTGYAAFEASGDWVHIRSAEKGDVWVNPKRTPFDRPQGIVKVDEQITLLKSDVYYTYPHTGDITHDKGFYGTQTVKANEKWVAPDGTVWYHFDSGTGTGEWVKRRDGVK